MIRKFSIFGDRYFIDESPGGLITLFLTFMCKMGCVRFSRIIDTVNYGANVCAPDYVFSGLNLISIASFYSCRLKFIRSILLFKVRLILINTSM